LHVPEKLTVGVSVNVAASENAGAMPYGVYVGGVVLVSTLNAPPGVGFSVEHEASADGSQHEYGVYENVAVTFSGWQHAWDSGASQRL
jgi:hypothetical protein